MKILRWGPRDILVDCVWFEGTLATEDRVQDRFEKLRYAREVYGMVSEEEMGEILSERKVALDLIREDKETGGLL